MQDIVFYVAAKETRGIVRDSANANTISAPNIVLGVSVCLKMRLFAACDVSTPFPIEKFTGIADWKWNMNAGFNRFGTVKVTSDPQSITVHSVIDTVDGNSMSFTEFVIPISEMNTQELEAYIGNEKEWSELNAELVGYSSAGDAEFVLQIKGFTIWNRIAGLGDPTVLDQEFATRSQTVRMIQEAVSSSAATKQDLLTSANAGTNISIDENGIITNTYSLPLATTASAGGVALATAAETVSGSNAAKVVTPASFKAALTGDDQIIAQSALNAFQSITDFGTTLSVSLESGKAYKLSAVAGNHYLSVPNIPVGKYGMDAHLKLFVGETSLVHVQDPLILMDALIPNAVNNCVIKYRDGEARMYVEDHDVGYVVTSVNGTAGTSLDGSLYYGLTGTTASYVVFANALNGQIVTLPEAATVNRSVNVVGNGYTQTVLSGGISCTSKTTFSNLGMNGVSVLGGMATLGDVFIPAGGTVSVSGGSIAVEKVSGNGGVVDLGETNIKVSANQSSYVGKVTITNGSAGNGGAVSNQSLGTVLAFSGTTFSANVGSTFGGALYLTSGRNSFEDCLFENNHNAYRGGVACLYGGNVSATFSNCQFASNYTNGNGGVLYLGLSAYGNFSSCVFLNNSANSGGVLFSDGANVKITMGGCVISGNTPSDKAITLTSGSLVFAGSNALGDAIAGTSGTVTISSGAIVDLTGNTNATPIDPGGGITFGDNVKIYPSAGSASAYMLGGMTVPQIGNTNVVNLGGTHVNVKSAFASNCTFTNGVNNYGGAFVVSNFLELNKCTVTANSAATVGGSIQLRGASRASGFLSSCIVSGNSNAYYPDDILTGESTLLKLNGGNTIGVVLAMGEVVFEGENRIDKLIHSFGATSGNGSVTISSGAIVDLTGNTNATPINPGGGIVISSGGISIIDSAGTTHEFQDLAITGATVNNLGQIFGATVSVPVSSTGVGPWNVSTTLGTSTVSATAEAQELVIDGGLVSIQEL